MSFTLLRCSMVQLDVACQHLSVRRSCTWKLRNGRRKLLQQAGRHWHLGRMPGLQWCACTNAFFASEWLCCTLQQQARLDLVLALLLHRQLLL